MCIRNEVSNWNFLRLITKTTLCVVGGELFSSEYSMCLIAKTILSVVGEEKFLSSEYSKTFDDQMLY